MEATSEQRQNLVETIFRRNYLRRKFEIAPLDIELEYARGLNRILRKNLAKQGSQPVLHTDQSGEMDCEIVYLFDR